MEIHGTNDGVNLWAGDYNNSTGWGVFYDIDSIIDFWSTNNSCTQLLTESFPDINTNDGSTVVAEKHFNSINNNEVWLYKVNNGGHENYSSLYFNNDNDTIDKIICEFDYTHPCFDHIALIGDCFFS